MGQITVETPQGGASPGDTVTICYVFGEGDTSPVSILPHVVPAPPVQEEPRELSVEEPCQTWVVPKDAVSVVFSDQSGQAADVPLPMA